VDRLVNKTWAKHQQTPLSKRLLIAVSGIPGSGGCKARMNPRQCRVLTSNERQNNSRRKGHTTPERPMA